MNVPFGAYRSLLSRIKRHAKLGVMFREPGERIFGDVVNPNLPVLRADYQLSGIGVAVRQARPIPQTVAPAAQPIRPKAPRPPQPVVADALPAAATAPAPAVAADNAAPAVPQPPPVIDGSITEYKPPKPVTDNQLYSILNAHARKQAAGETYERSYTPRSEQKRSPDEPVGKANLRRHLEAKEKIAKEGINAERLRRRPAVSYVGDAALPEPTKPPVVAPQSAEKPPKPEPMPAALDVDADADLLETMDGEKVDQPLLTDRPESDAEVTDALARVSAEQRTDSSIDLVLPRRARPKQP